MSVAHHKAFTSVLDHVKVHVVQQNKVLQLSSLRKLYVEEHSRNAYERSDYRSEKILKHLQEDPINDLVSFTKIYSDNGDAISFWLVYSSNIMFLML